MNYYEDNERTGRRAGVIATVVYAAVVALLLLLVRFDTDVSQLGEGILIDFGDVQTAGGSMSAAQPAQSDNRRPSDTPPVQNPAQQMTQDHEDAPAVQRQQPQPERTPSQSDRTQQAAQPAEEQPREVDPRAMFPGSRQQNTSQSQGSTQGEGRQGSQEGTPGGNPDGSGAGQNATGFSLSGRSILGSLPLPQYGPNKSGRVIIDITVDAGGKVVRAIPRMQGSTTNDNELVSAALKAAGDAVFNKVDGDGLQTGTITYNFILK